MSSPTRNWITVSNSSRYDADHGELAHTNAITAATSMTTPPAVSTAMNRRAGWRMVRGMRRSDAEYERFKS